MKQKAKKAVAANKVELCRTGGGVFTSQVDATDEKVLAAPGNRAGESVRLGRHQQLRVRYIPYLFVNKLPSLSCH